MMPGLYYSVTVMVPTKFGFVAGGQNKCESVAKHHSREVSLPQ